MSSKTKVERRYMDAIREAMADEMRADDRVCLMGIDVGSSGGVFGVTKGLYEEFGESRVLDTPISETGFVGAAVGAAATGLRPVVEIMFMDFLGVCLDPILNQAAKLRYMSGGCLTFPIVFKTQTGVGRSSGAQHSQSLEAILAHIPGIKIVMPGTVHDAYALMRAAIQDPNPVVYIENRRLYGKREQVTFEASPGLGKARVLREGSTISLIAWSRTVGLSLEVAESLSTEGIDVEVVDVRSLVPLDITELQRSVAKTGRAIVVHDAVVNFGAGAEICARVTEGVFHKLRSPILRLGGASVPLPFSPPLEAACIPTEESLSTAIRGMVAGTQ